MSKTIGIVLAMKDECSPKMKELAEKIGIAEQELKKADKTIKNFAKTTEKNFKNAVKITGASIAAFTGATAIAVKQSVGYGDEIDKQSQKLQMSRKTYQELSYIMSQNGSDVSLLGTANVKLAKAVNGVVSGNKAYTATFKALGISVKNSNGKLKDTETIMFDVLRKLQKMPDNAKRAALATTVFGKSALELQPLLNNTSTSIDDYRKKFEQIGYMSDEEIDNAVKLQDTFDTGQRTFQNISVSLVSDLIPVIQNITESIQSNLPQIKENIIPVIKSFVNVIKWTTENLNILIPIATGVLSAIVAFKTIGTTISIIKSFRDVIAAVNTVHGIWNALMLANPIGAIAIGVGIAIGSIVLLVKNWDIVTEKVKALWNWFTGTTFSKVISNLFSLSGPIEKLIKGWEKVIETVKNAGKALQSLIGIQPKAIDVKTSNTTVNGSHANGLSYVPFDGYIAQLHKGERVLSASETKNYNNNSTASTKIEINLNGDLIGNREFLDMIKFELGKELKTALEIV